MRSLITQTIKLLRIPALIAALGFGSSASAQTWCAAGNQWGCWVGTPNYYYAPIGQVQFVQDGKVIYNKADDGCSAVTAGSSTTNFVVNSGKPFDLTAGGTYTSNIAQNSSWGYAAYIGVWIDLNRDGNFANAEYMSSGWGTYASGALTSKNFTIPCTNVSPGRTRLRVRSEIYFYAMGPGNGCGNMNYGEVEDYDINLGLPTSLAADFFLPDPNTTWVKTRLSFINKNQKGYISHEWDGSDNGSGYDFTGTNWAKAFATAGTYSVKLRSTNCLGRDSISKNITIKAPSVVPVADFIASKNVCEQYDLVQLFDLSQYGPYDWHWEVYDSTQVPAIYYDETSRVNPPADPDGKKNPIFFMDIPGTYTVTLTAYNDNGWSPVFVKKAHIKVNPPSDYPLGNGALSTQVSSGRIYDHAGPNANYGTNRSNFVDRLLIQPCNATEINLKFSQIRLSDVNDFIKIYDGTDESGKALHPGSGINSASQASARNTTFTAKSGAMYITFQSNASGQDSGFIGTFTSKLGPQTPPTAAWSVKYKPAYNSTQVDFANTTTGKYGLMAYQWDIDEGGSLTQYFSENASHTFYTDGKYQVCLGASSCAGIDQYCDSIEVITPNKKTILDFVASNRRPKIAEEITLTIDADNANQFDWNIFPTTYTVTSGSIATSSNKILKLKLNSGGPYTFTLKGWNSSAQTVTQNTVVKDKYVVVLDYCTPVVNLVSADVGINNVKVTKGTSTLIDNASTSGVDQYTDYAETQVATMTFGAEYGVEVARTTTVNPMNRKVWIDFNIDGDFTDVGEEVLTESAATTASASAKFNVPFLKNSFEGKTRMRVGVSYSTYANTPCGANIVGEFEDYGIILANDQLPPVITLNGSDTVRVEKNCGTTTYVDAGAKAIDPTEGDITSRIVTTTDFDQCNTGIYTYVYNVEDASGNKAAPKRRVVIVVEDRTPPVLTLNGTSPMSVEQCGTFTDPGATAFDLVNKDLTSAIVASGTVNTNKLGSYVITYTVRDAQGNTATMNRTVNVVDTKKPTMMLNAAAITNGMTINVQINGVFVDGVYSDDPCTGVIATTKTPGFNGPVNTTQRATYPITYTSVDASSNVATNNGAVINYKVDDFIAPVIVLNTEDTVYLEVNSPYTSKAVTVTDNFYSASQVSVVKTGSVDPYTLGLYSETYTATDASGNSAVRTRYIRVRDTKAPQIIAPVVNVCIGYGFNLMDGLQITDNYYSPATLLPAVVLINHNINSWEAGVYYANYRVTDPSGNTSAVVSRPVFVGYPPNCQNTLNSWNLATGVNEFNLDAAVNVFPNPTNGKLSISYKLNNANPVSIEVYNATGVKVAEVGNAATGMATSTVDLSGASEGIYLVRLSNNGQTTTQKVVVKH